VHYKRLTEAQFLLLDALRQVLPLGEACEPALRDRSRPRPEHLRRWFGDWALLGWFWLPTA